MNSTDNKTTKSCHLEGFGDKKGKTQQEKRNLKKVRFARNLEYWKLYDKETGMFISGSQFKDNGNTKLGKRNWKTKIRTITDVVESFQKREADMKCFATLKPHRVLEIGSKEPSVHFKVPMTVPNNAITASDTNIDEYKETATKFKVAFNQTGFRNLNRGKTICHNSMTFTINQLPIKQTQLFDHEQFTGSADFQRNSMTYGLPSVCNGRKIYDERLLPAIYTERTNTLGTKTLVSIKETLQSTPYIVQLFE